MHKFILKFIINIISLCCLWLIFILPSQWYKIGPFGEILPAFEIIIIYYFCTYHELKDWHLFIIGIIIDQIYMFPPGTSPLTLILGNIFLIYFNRWFLLRNYFTNLATFYGYSAFIIIARYLIIFIKSDYPLEGTAIIFYYLTTIFSYPLLSIIVSITTLGRNAR